MDKNNLLKTAFILGLLIVGNVVAQAGMSQVIAPINCIACRVAQILIAIVIIIATIIVLLAGVKWVGSPDDPAARGAARLMIIHTLVGAILVLVAVFVVSYVLGGLGIGGIDPKDWIGGCANECTGISYTPS